jgi:hypothetical protein
VGSHYNRDKFAWFAKSLGLLALPTAFTNSSLTCQNPPFTIFLQHRSPPSTHPKPRPSHFPSTMPDTPNPLPTAYLVSPSSLAPSSYPFTLAPAPLAISATLASLVILLITILLARKRKDVFLDDRIEGTTPSMPTLFTAPRRMQISNPVLVRAPDIPQLAATRSRTRPGSTRRRTHQSDWQPTFDQGRKVNAMFGWQGDAALEHSAPVHTSAHEAPRRESEFDGDKLPRHRDKLGGDDATLAHSERNSAYVPYWHSDVSGGGSLRSSRSWMFDVERRSPVSFGGVEGDPY